MDWIKKISIIAACISVVAVVYSCRVSFGLAPISSIDYTKVKTISIADFQNRAEYVYAPLAIEFNTKLKDMFIQQTRLKIVDICFEGKSYIDRKCTLY